MALIAKTAAGMKLLRWNKALSLADASDPLGLSLRVFARLANELLFCITTTSFRARYYSFFPWAFDDYNEGEYHSEQDRGRIPAVLARERALVLGAVFHHEGKACRGGGLGGSEAAVKVRFEPTKRYELKTWLHLKSQPDGQFGAAYKGSLINLGIFEGQEPIPLEVDEPPLTSDVEPEKEPDGDDLRALSPLGHRLATAFGRSIAATRYVTEGWSRKDSIPGKILKDFGARAGLCELTAPDASDRNVLRDMFFARLPETRSTAHERRRLSLLYIMNGIRQANEAEVWFGEWTFNDIAYFGEALNDNDGKHCIIKTPRCLEDIGLRWQVFYAQTYLALSLQAILVALLAQLRPYPAGLDHSELLRRFDVPALSDFLKRELKFKAGAGFFESSAADVMCEGGWGTGSNATPVAMRDGMSERSLVYRLDDGGALESFGLPVAVLVLYGTLLRYRTRVGERYQNWYLQQVKNQYSDISVPGVERTLISQFGPQWLERSNFELVEAISSRFIVRQHQMMSYERSGSPPLFSLDGSTLIPREKTYTNHTTPNRRLFSALQILCDLALTEPNDTLGYVLTDRGTDYLLNQLSEQERFGEADRPA